MVVFALIVLGYRSISPITTSRESTMAGMPASRKPSQSGAEPRAEREPFPPIRPSAVGHPRRVFVGIDQRLSRIRSQLPLARPTAKTKSVGVGRSELSKGVTTNGLPESE